jgi:uncharacterized damage-inducible protein DinB
MIDADFARTMAAYNRWMNERVYARCGELSDAERRRDRGAFFASIHGTLNHLVYADLAFLSRFTGDPPDVPPLGTELYADFAELAAVRAGLDARLVAWADALSEAWLAAPFTYTSNVDGRTRTLPTWVLVAHLFNHQAHHRGQLTTLLTQSGRDVGVTDLPFMPGVAAVSPAPPPHGGAR